MRRLRAWLWRVTHRREARRFDEYMRQIYQWADEYDARRDEWTPMPPGADSERVAERLDRYVGER